MLSIFPSSRHVHNERDSDEYDEEQQRGRSSSSSLHNGDLTITTPDPYNHDSSTGRKRQSSIPRRQLLSNRLYFLLLLMASGGLIIFCCLVLLFMYAHWSLSTSTQPLTMSCPFNTATTSDTNDTTTTLAPGSIAAAAVVDPAGGSTGSSLLVGRASSSGSSLESSFDLSIPLSTLSAQSHDPLRIDRLVYSSSSSSSPPIPAVVQSFRAGHVDWHQLLPFIPPSGNDKLDFERLVASERAMTKTLVYDYNKHDRWQWGTTHGPLVDYTLCPTLWDKCTIHNRADCLHNSLCGWCKTNQQCVDRFGRPSAYDPLKQPPCENKDLEVGPQLNESDINSCDDGAEILHVDNGHVRRFPSMQQLLSSTKYKCEHRITDRVMTIELNGGTQAMFYHFITEHLNPLYIAHYGGSEQRRRVKDRYTHFVVSAGSIDQYHDIYGILTTFCPRYPHEFTTSNICFCSPSRKHTNHTSLLVPVSARLPASSSLQDLMVQVLGLSSITPVPGKPSLGLISRQQKRFILNELELISVAHSLNISAKLLPLEYMTLYEQIREFRRVNFLAGIHGSGLTNFMFLHPHGKLKFGYHSVAIQLMPYKVTSGASFFIQFSAAAAAIYREWTNMNRSATLTHNHFLNEQDNRAIEKIMTSGTAGTGTNFFSFWINQDTIVDVHTWKSMLQESLMNTHPFVVQPLMTHLNSTTLPSPQLNAAAAAGGHVTPHGRNITAPDKPSSPLVTNNDNTSQAKAADSNINHQLPTASSSLISEEQQEEQREEQEEEQEEDQQEQQQEEQQQQQEQQSKQHILNTQQHSKKITTKQQSLTV